MSELEQQTHEESEDQGLEALKEEILRTRRVEEPIYKYFSYMHLPANAQSMGKMFKGVADVILMASEPNTERTMALRKLLEAKDCAIRATLFKENL